MKKICTAKVLVITWCILLFTSCSNVTNSSSNENQVEAVVNNINTKAPPEVSEKEVLDSWLKESISQQAIIDKLGNPIKRGEDEYWDAIGTYVQNWEYPNLGISLEMESENQGGDKRVLSITIIQPCNFATTQGIKIGYDEKLVKEKYLKLIDTTFTDKNAIVVGSIYGGTIFYLKEGVVSSIFIGAVAE